MLLALEPATVQRSVQRRHPYECVRVFDEGVTVERRFGTDPVGPQPSRARYYDMFDKQAHQYQSEY